MVFLYSFSSNPWLIFEMGSSRFREVKQPLQAGALDAGALAHTATFRVLTPSLGSIQANQRRTRQFSTRLYRRLRNVVSANSVLWAKSYILGICRCWLGFPSQPSAQLLVNDVNDQPAWEALPHGVPEGEGQLMRWVDMSMFFFRGPTTVKAPTFPQQTLFGKNCSIFSILVPF